MTVEQNRQMLDYCQKVGLKAMISDGRMVYSIDNKAANKAALDAIVKDYSDHPALYGYFIADEPGAGAYPGLRDVVAYLKEKDPKHVSFINLLPTFARELGVLGTPTYEAYVGDYARIVRPFAISYDDYHLTNHGDREDWFENLATVRKVSLESKIPFWNIILAVQHGDYRNLTAPELRFEAMQTLAFGGKGLLWFTYWSPAGMDQTTEWHHAIINPDGSKDPHYNMIKALNADVLAIGNELVPCESIDVFVTGHQPSTREVVVKNSASSKPAESSPIALLDAGDFTVGVFKSPEGKHLALIASRDYKKESSVRATIAPVNAAVESFDPATKQWSPAPIHERGVVEIMLPAGGATLLRW